VFDYEAWIEKMNRISSHWSYVFAVRSAEELVAFTSSIALMSSTGILLVLPIPFSEEITLGHDNGSFTGSTLSASVVFGAYCCSGTLPDQFRVGKFHRAGSAKFAPIP